MRTRSPAASDRRQSSPASGSTPTTRPTPSARAIVAQPEMRPPPPTGTTSVSSGPASSISSSAAVPCAGHHERVVVRADELEPSLGRECAAERLAIVGVAVVRDDLGPVAARRLDLRDRRVGGHQDRRQRAQQPRGERDGLCVVARRVRHDRRPRGQRRDLRVRAAELERARTLQALRLQHDAVAERARGDRRRPMRDAGEHAGRRPNVVGADHATRFERTPMPSISSSTTSPRCSQRPSPCSRMHPVPTVPDPITSPGSNTVLRAPARAARPSGGTGRADCRASAPRRSRAPPSRRPCRRTRPA